jgi:sialate O-acetylesterase
LKKVCLCRPIAMLMLYLWSSCSLHLQAEVRLPRIIGDHAVLQREIPIHIWGWADPGEAVSVTFHQQNVSTTTDEMGQWSLYLRPEPAGGPYDLKVAGSNTITVTDLLIGDVWFAAGQSNMEMPLSGFPGRAVLKNSAQEIASANQPNIRLLHVPLKPNMYPLDDQSGDWKVCTPETAASFSAVAYFFGRNLEQREHVPIGLIDSTFGGTLAEAWISLDGLTADASLLPFLSSWSRQADTHAAIASALAYERRVDTMAKQAGQPAVKHPPHASLDSMAPAGLFNGMVAPITPFSMKGIIWYQGENNTRSEHPELYQRLFSALIRDWRSKWQEGNMPFLYVQISSFRGLPTDKWGLIRDAQRRTLDVSNTAMAVSLDVGDPNNPHYPDKQTVGLRLALAARSLVYGEKIEYSGPLFLRATREGAGMRIWFEPTTDQLVAKSAGKGADLTGFEVAGDDHRFLPATARIEGDTVVVSNAHVPNPFYVRYAWANASPATLFNKAGLPASTFTSEDPVPAPCAATCEN